MDYHSSHGNDSFYVASGFVGAKKIETAEVSGFTQHLETPYFTNISVFFLDLGWQTITVHPGSILYTKRTDYTQTKDGFYIIPKSDVIGVELYDV